MINPYKRMKRIARWFLDWAAILSGFVTDAFAYGLYAQKTHWSKQDAAKRRAKISACAHAIEKGLSLKESRPGFGRPMIGQLIDLLQAHARAPDTDPTKDSVYLMAVDALYKYIEQARNAGLDIAWIEQDVQSLGSNGGNAGAITCDRNTWQAALDLPFREFCRTRHSVRGFANEPVPQDLLREAFDAAQTAPSSCNRQASRSYVSTEPEKIQELLRLQGGARGFAEQVHCLVAVANDLSAWAGSGERTQAHIDGGMYAMNLLLGLHAVGLGACPLICLRKKALIRHAKRILGIPASHSLIMFIAVGVLEESITFAASRRLTVEETVTFR